MTLSFRHFSFLLAAPLALGVARAAAPGQAWFAAAQKGDVAALKSLLAKGTDVNAQNADGDTALLLASRQGHAPAVLLLLGKKAQVNTPGKGGETALYAGVGLRGRDGVQAPPAAAEYDARLRLTAALLKKGANPNLATQAGDTPLHRVARNSYSFPQAAALLAQHGALVNRLNPEGKTPLDLYRDPLMPRMMDPGMDNFFKAHRALGAAQLAEHLSRSDCQDKTTRQTMTWQAALAGAQGSACGEGTWFTGEAMCDSATGAWRLTLGSTQKPACTVSCVVPVSGGQPGAQWVCLAEN